MPRSGCDVCCAPEELARSNPTYTAAHLRILCSILEAIENTNSGIRYDWEVLCDPTTGQAVFVRFEYDVTGTIIGTEGFNPDGSPYGGALNGLIDCDEAVAVLEAAYATLVTKAFSFFTGSYQTVGLITSGAAKEIFVNNDTDGTYLISFDGLNDQFRIAPYTQRWFTYKTIELKESSDMQVKYSIAPSVGNVYFEAIK